MSCLEAEAEKLGFELALLLITIMCHRGDPPGRRSTFCHGRRYRGKDQHKSNFRYQHEIYYT